MPLGCVRYVSILLPQRIDVENRARCLVQPPARDLRNPPAYGRATTTTTGETHRNRPADKCLNSAKKRGIQGCTMRRPSPQKIRRRPGNGRRSCWEDLTDAVTGH